MSDLSAQLNELLQRGFTHVEDREEAKTMWSIYTKEVNKYDEQVTTAQKDDANSLLVFTGLFSAVVAVFVLESYKKLESGNGTTDPASFSPSRAMIWVNALWFLSLVTGIASAFYVMLVQQWVRRYTQMIQDLSSDDGPVRSSLFLGTQKYQMSHAIGLIPLPLHISIFLFFSGLIIFLYDISHIIAVTVTVGVGVTGLIYFVLTILPTLDDACPYFTPLSDVWWYLWYTHLSAAAYCLRWPLRRLLSHLKRHSLGHTPSQRERKLSQWLEFVKKAIKKYKQCLKGGLQGIIVRRAIDAPIAVDPRALTWLLQRPAMAEKSNIQDFVACVPGMTLIELMSAPKNSRKITFREHLYALLRSCVPSTVGLDKGVRRRRLLICLKALHHIVKATFLPYGVSPSPALLDDLRDNFASIETMRELWVDSHPAIRIMSRSICALLARHIILLSHRDRSGPEVAWLEAVVGKRPGIDGNYSDDIVGLDRMNLKSFVYSVLSYQMDHLSPKHATFFAETLAILMNAGGHIALSRDIFEEQLAALIQRTEDDDDQHRDEVVAKLHDMLHDIKQPGRYERRNMV